MADLGFTGWIKDYEQQSMPPHLMHTIQPSAGWTSDAECYYLIMELPDFKQDEVEVDVDPSGNLIITGSRLSGTNEHVKFKRHLKLPEDSDMTKPVSRKLQNDMLYITVRRQLVKPDRFEFDESTSKEEMREEPENKDKDAEGERETRPDSNEEKIEKDAEGEREAKTESKEGKVDDKKRGDYEGKKEDNMPRTMLKKLDQHKCIWFGILAFAFGVLVGSHKLQQPPRR